MMTTTRAALLAAVLAVLPGAALADQPMLTLSAEGSVTAVPDTAVVSLGVEEQAETAGDALSANNAAMERLLEAVQAAGVAERDVATSNFSIEPVMVYPEPKPDGTQEPPRIVGYRVSNLVTVKIRDVSRAGGILDQVVRVGANRVSGLSFVVDDDAALLDRARVEAMKAATDRARLYAEAGGFTIGRILSVSESGGAVPYQQAPMMAMAEAKAARVPVAAGEQTIAVTVNVSWEIHPAR